MATAANERHRHHAVDWEFEQAAPPQADILYDDLRFLNQGSFGTVHTALHAPSGRRVALKEMRKTPQNNSSLRREADISLRLRHPGIIATHDAFETSTSVFIVQEYMDGGDLYDYVETSGMAAGPESQIKLWFMQLVSAVEYMHSVAGYVHRDIKPENVILSSNMLDVKLLDFGLSRPSDARTRPLIRGRAGTDPYMPEEVFSMGEDDAVDGRAADIWSLGITLFAMLVGQFPWKAATYDDAAYAMYAERFELMYRTGGEPGAVLHRHPAKLTLTPHVWELLDRLLAPSADERIVAADIMPYIDLPWFSQHHPLYEPQLRLLRSVSLTAQAVPATPPTEHRPSFVYPPTPASAYCPISPDYDWPTPQLPSHHPYHNHASPPATATTPTGKHPTYLHPLDSPSEPMLSTGNFAVPSVPSRPITPPSRLPAHHTLAAHAMDVADNDHDHDHHHHTKWAVGWDSFMCEEVGRGPADSLMLWAPGAAPLDEPSYDSGICTSA